MRRVLRSPSRSRPAFRRTLFFIGSALAALFVLIVWSLPPRRLPLDAPAWLAAPVVAGAFHVHTRRSDGTGSPDEVAAAARRAGLAFVVFADHGDATRPLDPPLYRDGVLCLDGVEISTTGGHYVAVGLSPSPYPLGGEPRAVVEDVARLGGLGIVAHPDSAKPDLRWRDWSLPIDGFEWINADSEWRNERTSRLALAVLQYVFRPPETLASLLDRPSDTLQRWDRLGLARRLVAVAGADAHARIGLRSDAEPYRTTVVARIPSYEAMFRAFSLRAVLDAPFARDARRDAEALLAALRAGRTYTAIDALAGPPALSFVARTGARETRMGESVAASRAPSLEARINPAPGAQIVLFRDGEAVQVASGTTLRFDSAGRAGAYRVEARLPGAPGSPPVPWMVSNAIALLPEEEPAIATVTRSAPPASSSLFDPGERSAWRVEHDSTSRGGVRLDGRALLLEYSLGRSKAAAPYVALVRDVAGLEPGDRLTVRVRASRPLRLSVQVRVPADGEGRRWQRSVFLQRGRQDVRVAIDEMTPVERGGAAPFDPARVRSLLFVVDTTNTSPGSAGLIGVEAVTLVKP